MRKKLLVVFLVVFTAALPAQQGIFTFYSVSEGLAQSTVTALYRDPQGYLWVGTGDGLSVFNGYEFRNFKSRYGDSTAISNNRIRGIYPSGDGQHVWVGSEDGLNLFSRNALAPPQVFHLSGDSKTLMPTWSDDTASWIMHPVQGIYRYSHNKKTFTLQYAFHSDVFFKAYPLKTNGEFVFINRAREVTWYSMQKGELRKYTLPENIDPFHVHAVLELEKGKLLLGTTGGLFLLDLPSGQFTEFSFGDPAYEAKKFSIKDLCADPDGRIWIACQDDGLYLYDPKLKRVRPCAWEQSGETVRKKLANIQSLLCDDYGVLWAGTTDEGLVRINTRRILFSEEYLSPVVTDTCNWFVRSLFMNGGRMWIGTFNEGLKTIDRHSGAVKTTGVGENGKSPGSVNAIAPGPGNSLYLGTENGLALLDTVTWKQKQIPSETGTVLFVNCLLRCRDGTLLVGTKSGLFRLDRTGRLVLQGGLRSNIQALYEEENGTVVASTFYYGLHFFSPDGQLLREDLFGRPSSKLPQITVINGIANDKSGNYWASSNLGLLQFNRDWTLQKIFTDLDGLPENMLYGLMALPDHTLLIASGKGISIFDPEKQTFTNYDSKDGLKSDECNARALFLSIDNYVLIGGVNGFDYIHFPFRQKATPSPAILLDQQQVFDETFHPGANGFYTQQLSLGYRQNTFSFQLWQTDFAFSERAVFHYSLQGFDEQEVEAGNRRYVRYAGVQPGDYAFGASVLLPGGIKTSQPGMLSVKIIPPFWQTTWFLVVFVVVLIALIVLSVYFTARVRYKKQLRRLEMQRELERVRIRISGDIHDDIGAGLTRIALAGDLASMQLQENDPQKERIAGMAVAARALSQSLKEVVWSVKPDYDRYDSMVRYFRDYCGEFFESTSTRCNFKTDETLSTAPVSPEVRRNLFLILKEALNNSVKHANATVVDVTVRLDEQKIEMSIMDNGKGFNVEKETGMNSSGLKNMRRRAEMIRFEMEISPAEPGTCIRVEGKLE